MNELPDPKDATVADVAAAGASLERALSALADSRDRQRAEDRLTNDIEAAFNRYWKSVFPGRQCRVMAGRHPDAPPGSSLAAWAEPVEDQPNQNG